MILRKYERTDLFILRGLFEVMEVRDQEIFMCRVVVTCKRLSRQNWKAGLVTTPLRNLHHSSFVRVHDISPNTLKLS